MPLKFVTLNDDVFQLLGDFVPIPGLRPTLGGLSSPRPFIYAVLKFLLEIPYSPRTFPALRSAATRQVPGYVLHLAISEL